MLIACIVIFVACGNSDEYEYTLNYETQEENGSAQGVVPVPTQFVSEAGEAAAIAFLADFWSIFDATLGWYNPATNAQYFIDTWSLNWDWLDYTPNPLPRVFLGIGTDIDDDDIDMGEDWDYRWGFWFNGTFYDANGNVLADKPFIRLSDLPYANPLLARSFSLFDFDGSGYPTIIVDFVSWQSGAFGINALPSVFRFINGQYTFAGTLSNQAYDFFKDEEGNIIVLYNNQHDGVESYSHITFADEHIRHVLASPLEDDWWLTYSWMDHHDESFYASPHQHMFITNTPITRIAHLDDLHNRITQYLSK